MSSKKPMTQAGISTLQGREDVKECSAEIALERPAGGSDGCLSQKTTRHVCVPDSEVAGPPCEQEIAKACPPSQVDACQIQAATTHLCVYEPAGSR